MDDIYSFLDNVVWRLFDEFGVPGIQIQRFTLLTKDEPLGLGPFIQRNVGRESVRMAGDRADYCKPFDKGQGTVP